MYILKKMTLKFFKDFVYIIRCNIFQTLSIFL